MRLGFLPPSQPHDFSCSVPLPLKLLGSTPKGEIAASCSPCSGVDAAKQEFEGHAALNISDISEHL